MHLPKFCCMSVSVLFYRVEIYVHWKDAYSRTSRSVDPGRSPQQYQKWDMYSTLTNCGAVFRGFVSRGLKGEARLSECGFNLFTLNYFEVATFRNTIRHSWAHFRPSRKEQLRQKWRWLEETYHQWCVQGITRTLQHRLVNCHRFNFQVKMGCRTIKRWKCYDQLRCRRNRWRQRFWSRSNSSR